MWMRILSRRASLAPTATAAAAAAAAVECRLSTRQDLTVEFHGYRRQKTREQT